MQLLDNSDTIISFYEKSEQHFPTGSTLKDEETNLEAEFTEWPGISVEKSETKQEVEDSHRICFNVNEKELFHQNCYKGQSYSKTITCK